MAIVYVALGANLGDREAAIGEAARRLGMAPGLTVAAVSPLYETDAVADEPQPDYLNAVLRTQTTLPPRAVLDLCLGIERAMGRVRPPGVKQAPRVIDLDLVLHGDAIVSEPGLDVPHPRLHRPFVRVPLADVAVPGLRHPVTGESLDVAPDRTGVRDYRPSR